MSESEALIQELEALITRLESDREPPRDDSPDPGAVRQIF